MLCVIVGAVGVVVVVGVGVVVVVVVVVVAVVAVAVVVVAVAVDVSKGNNKRTSAHSLCQTATQVKLNGTSSTVMHDDTTQLKNPCNHTTDKMLDTNAKHTCTAHY